MNKYIRHLFFLIGIVAILVMVVGFDLSFESLKSLLNRVGIYFPLALLLWVIIYAINTLSWRQLLNSLDSRTIPWCELYKFTVSGFAINYITPGGLNGGEPYRILELREYVGTTRATSSTLLYVIIHIGSHLLFWALGAIMLMVKGLSTTYAIGALLVIVVALCLLYAFHLLMKNGVTDFFTLLLLKLPWLGKYIYKFKEKNRNILLLIDQEVREVYTHRPCNFYSAFGLEFLARIVGCLEISFFLMPLMGTTNFLYSYLIIAIASLMGNLLFFLPMQLGGREGGFTLAFTILHLSPQYGLFVGLLVRLRELVWIGIGVFLIQMGKRRSIKKDS